MSDDLVSRIREWWHHRHEGPTPQPDEPLVIKVENRNCTIDRDEFADRMRVLLRHQDRLLEEQQREIDMLHEAVNREHWRSGHEQWLADQVRMQQEQAQQLAEVQRVCERAFNEPVVAPINVDEVMREVRDLNEASLRSLHDMQTVIQEILDIPLPKANDLIPPPPDYTPLPILNLPPSNEN